jgi:hypothetical protein
MHGFVPDQRSLCYIQECMQQQFFSSMIKHSEKNQITLTIYILYTFISTNQLHPSTHSEVDNTLYL